MMQYPIIAILLCIVIAGCARQEDSNVSFPSEQISKSADSPNRYLAYEHSISLDVNEDHVAVIHKAVENACQQAVAEQCVVLESHLNTGRYTSAEIKVRAKPEGIRKIIASLASQGKVIEQATKASDLASPIEDSAKKLEMLNDYRTKLEALREKAKNDIDSLIKVNKELAYVQSEIESISGERAHLLQRVNTEILRILISPLNTRSFWRPIRNTIGDFSRHLSEGISSVIVALAFIIPWSIMLLTIWWGWRKIRLRWKQASS